MAKVTRVPPVQNDDVIIRLSYEEAMTISKLTGIVRVGGPHGKRADGIYHALSRAGVCSAYDSDYAIEVNGSSITFLKQD